MSTRRHTDPYNVIRIWNAIKSTKQTQVDVFKIVKYLHTREEYTPQQAEIYIDQCYKDKLILLSRGSGKPSDHLTAYRITTQELPELGDHDWYCFECHKAGEVRDCKKCHRVYHQHCISKAQRRFETYKKTNNYNVYKNRRIMPDHMVNISPNSDELFGEHTDPEIKGSDSMVETEVHSSLTEEQKELNERINYKYNINLCSVCNIKNADVGCILEKEEMNYLLKFVLDRISTWLPRAIIHTMAPEEKPDYLTDTELTWRANQLFYEHKDMSVIEVNLNSIAYEKLADFLADIYTVQHNVAIFHGLDAQEYGATELMIRDTLYDLTELKNCPDCYKHSNEKINQKWFCLPCRNNHELVWAKQRGYPYWPAKVLKETPTQYDVRFFGGKYERALLQKNLVKPISVPKETLQIKSSSAFSKALEELEYHRTLLNNPHELEKLKASSKLNRKTLNKRTPLLHVTESPLAGPTSSFDNGTPPLKKRRGRPPGSSTKKKPEKADKPAGDSSISGNSVIHISDGEDDELPAEYSYRDNSSFGNGLFNIDDHFEQVSSSTENFRNSEAVGSTNNELGMHRLDQPYSDAVEKMRRMMEGVTDQKTLIKMAMDCMQSELDKLTNNHNEHLKRLFESHNNQISETKKKQWCYNCEQDAIYHCCWNTAYCSQTCQQQHWQAEHKKVCRRKRPDSAP
ncbi:zinc finger MYND domain-containing protein 11 isoform X2 [Aethina tumida]|nr:zinc finger MYND domain-containing protein 11 isoform X2 [Aethina tumida]